MIVQFYCQIAHSDVPMFQHNWKLMIMSLLTINKKVTALAENQGKYNTYFKKINRDDMGCFSSGGLNNTNQTKQRLDVSHNSHFVFLCTPAA